MKKLKLNLEDLKVESFETNSIQSKQGTIFGLATNPYETLFVTCTCPTQYQACLSEGIEGGCTYDYQVCQEETVFVTCVYTCQPIEMCVP